MTWPPCRVPSRSTRSAPRSPRCTPRPGTSRWTPRPSSRCADLSRTAPLVFLPTHRSYADPLVLAEVLRENDLPRNTVLGGNNMSFWPIGPLGKRAGIVFIRRSSGDDPVYKLALREYIAHLVSKRFNLEWYIEGGRSRTGKLRSPQLGLLAYLAARPRRRPRARTWRWCRPRSSTTGSTSSTRWPPSRAGRGSRPRAWAGSRATSAGRPATTAPPGCASASRSPSRRRWPRRARDRPGSRRSRSPSATGSTARRRRPRRRW